jgi:hypothetical protein
MARKFKDLTEREILAVAIGLEEEDGRVYADAFQGLQLLWLMPGYWVAGRAGG